MIETTESACIVVEEEEEEERETERVFRNVERMLIYSSLEYFHLHISLATASS
jgi:hypothetical protein